MRVSYDSRLAETNGIDSLADRVAVMSVAVAYHAGAVAVIAGSEGTAAIGPVSRPRIGGTRGSVISIAGRRRRVETSLEPHNRQAKQSDNSHSYFAFHDQHLVRL